MHSRPYFSHGTRAAIESRVESACVRMHRSVLHICLSILQVVQTHRRCISLAAAVSPSRKLGCARAIKACALSVEESQEQLKIREARASLRFPPELQGHGFEARTATCLRLAAQDIEEEQCEPSACARGPRRLR